MKGTEAISGYRYVSAETNLSHDYLLPTIRKELERLALRGKNGCSIWVAETAALGLFCTTTAGT